jgi:hypothetical protein
MTSCRFLAALAANGGMYTDKDGNAVKIKATRLMA